MEPPASCCLRLVDDMVPVRDGVSMTMKELRDHIRAEPFRPFVVRTVSGCRHPVNHPDFLLIPPVGNTFLVVEPTGRMHHIGISHVEAVEMRVGRTK